MDYSKINRNKKMEESQKGGSDDLQDSKQNTSTNQIIKQDALEPQRDYYNLNKFAKNDAQFHQHSQNLYPLPYQKQHNEARDPKQVSKLTSTCLEATSSTKHANLDISYKNPRNATPTELTVPSEHEVSISIPDSNIAQNLKQEKQKNVGEHCSTPTTSTSSNSLKGFAADRLNDNGSTKSYDTNQFLQSPSHSPHNDKANENPQKLIIGHPKNTDMDDEETIEKIAEMIANSSNDLNKNSSPKTKKQLQILMSRSYTDPNWIITHENNSKNNNDQVRIKNRQNQIKIDITKGNHETKASEITKEATPSVNSNLVSGSLTLSQSLKMVPESKGRQSTEIIEVKTLDKNRFEEVENKLEEMFAGIEDEQLMHPANTKCGSHVNNDKIAKELEIENIKFTAIAHKSSEILQNVKTGENSTDCYKNKSLLLNNSSLPTKAAKKSTDSFILNPNKIKLPPEKETDIDAKKYLKSMAPRRRLSVGIDPSLLRISLESHREINRKPKEIADKDLLNQNCMAKEIKHIPKRSKVKANRSKNCTEENKDDIYLKSTNNYNNNNNNNKKKIVGTDTHKAVTKQNQQILKHRRMQLSLSFDNDNDHDERNQQTRELDNKIRSPFILVKHNGTITVVNTASSDDYNEKNTKAKKTGTYVHERKNVRGCHSSTLSNRYDADTADSTWICVFCKCGPHKKGLGDLFGPYIVSLDCEDYRSAVNIYTQDSSFTLNKRRRTDLKLAAATFSDFVASSGKTGWKAKCPSETHISDILNIAEDDADKTSLHMFSLGMSRISESNFEIWVHEDCAIWAPNLFVIGSRLVGLEAAIWNSTRHKCVFCSKPGAMICCLQRHCKITAHVPCARESNWSLDELTFWAHCKEHVLKTLPLPSLP